MFQSVMNKQFDELGSVKIGTIETNNSTPIELKAKILLSEGRTEEETWAIKRSF